MYVIVILIISVACYWATVVQFFWGLAAVWGGRSPPSPPPWIRHWSADTKALRH